MRLLLDINILLDVVFERPGQAASAEVIAKSGSEEFEAWVAWHTLATLYYLVERQTTASQARSVIAGLLEWSQVAPTSQAAALQALDLPMKDFEDALQTAAALACGARFIVTRNQSDFTRSPVAAVTPEVLLAQASAGPQPTDSQK